MNINKIDRLLLYYPLFIYALIALYFLNQTISVGTHNWGRIETQISSILAFVIFGNFAHNFMSFWQIFRVQEFKDWSQEYRFYGLSIFQIIAIVFIFFISLILLILPPGFNTFLMVFGENQTVNFIVFFFFTINTHHNLSQMKGIGFSHNFHYLKETPQETQIALHKNESRFYQFLLADWFFYVGWLRFSSRENFYLITIIRSIIFCIALGLLIRTYLRLPKNEAKIKMIYSARHIYRLFFSLHPVFVFLAYALHGADAVLTYWKTLEKTQSPRPFALKVEFSIIIAMLSVMYIVLFQIYKPRDFVTFQNVLVSMFLTHYVVEGFLYRFRNPVTKKHILQLL